MAFPLGSLYHGTKFAIEGLSEALHYEMATIADIFFYHCTERVMYLSIFAAD